MLQRLDAGADVGGTLHHEHVLLLGVLRQQSAAENILEYFNFQSHQSTINFADKPFLGKYIRNLIAGLCDRAADLYDVGGGEDAE